MSDVEFSAMRDEGIAALRSLSETTHQRERRDEGIAALRSLSETTHQREKWGRVDPEISHYDDLTLNVHILFDDCAVLPNPASAVPAVLRQSDVPAFEVLEGALGSLLEELGDRPDAEYLAHPDWLEVVRAARGGLDAMRASDTRVED